MLATLVISAQATEQYPTTPASPAASQATPITPSRSVENLRATFEKRKGSIYAQYQKALRHTPSLTGKIVLELRIESNGRVSECNVVSSTMKNLVFQAELRRLVETFDFGPAQVTTTVIDWPVDFLPR
jgi:periplasmic protein TonB